MADNQVPTKKRLIIDTDAGIDDAQAISMALNSPGVEVVAITTCHGNTGADQVCKNVLRLLKVAGRLDIPVYPGCNKSLLGGVKSAAHVHGQDGFGDVPDPDAPDISLAQKDHAVTALIRLVKDNPNELTLVALAPCTNIAMALRLEPGLGSLLKDCFMMGGNYEGKGNVTPSAEFNFHTDPEAAHVVLAELGCPLYLVCWELCVKHSLSWEWYDGFLSHDNPRSRFLRQMERRTVDTYHGESARYITADQLAMAVALAGQTVVKRLVQLPYEVQLSGSCLRGMVAVDWRQDNDKQSVYSSSFHGNNDGVYFVLDVNQDAYKEMLARIPL